MTIGFSIVLSYLIGSVPSGLWFGLRLRGIDIRNHGSKNIGATNTMRVLGKRLGGIALFCDIIKGAIPVLVAAKLNSWDYLALSCGIAAIMGHVTSPFVKFRGGKGVATSAGVFLALCPIPMLIAIATFAIFLGLTRMVSAGSICAALSLAISVCMMDFSIPLRVIAVLVATLVIFRHRTNITRIFKGTENRI